jgi:hypothetical protein
MIVEFWHSVVKSARIPAGSEAVMQFLHFTTTTHSTQLLVNGIPLGDIVGTFALLVALYAAVKASKSAREAARGNILNGMPVLIIMLRRPADTSQHFVEFVLDNIGKSPAFAIDIEEFLWWITGGPMSSRHGLRLKLKVPNPGVLNSHTQVPLRALDPRTGKDSSWMTDSALTHSKLELPIRYSDATGKKYITEIRFIDGHTEILRPPRYFGIQSKTRYILRYRFRDLLFRMKIDLLFAGKQLKKMLRSWH